MNFCPVSADSASPLRLRPTILSLYFALVAVVFALHAYRVTVNTAWTYDLALSAAVGDLAVLSLSVGLFLVVRYVSRTIPALRRLNVVVHALFLLCALLTAWVSQLLLIRTGESLDVSIILFTLQHADDIFPVIGGEANGEALVLFLLCLLPLLLMSIKGGSRTIILLRNLVLLTPVVLLPACSLIDEDVDSLKTVVPLAPGEQKGLYQGLYADWKHHEKTWGLSSHPGWRLGIFSSLLLGDSLGKSEYLALAQTAGTAKLYSDVRYVGRGSEGGPNIVLIILESFRHDVVDVYLPEAQNGKPGNTPFLNYLANAGVLVERAYTTIPHTSKALVGIYCGTFPRLDSAIAEAAPGGMPIRCLPHLLSEAGYSTAHFQTASGEFEDRTGLLTNAGFGHFVTEEDLDSGKWGRAGYLGLEDRAMVAPVVEWMKQEKAGGRPYFASILTLATHHPYAFPGNEEGVGTTVEARNSYLRGVRYTDAMLRELFAAMAGEGLMENTIFVLTGDHGEAFGEHGQILHNGVSYEEGQRVPLIFYSPDHLPAGARVEGLRQHVDLMPTLLAFANVVYEGRLPGMNLFADKGHESIITSCFYTDYCLNYYRYDGYKMSYFFGKREPVIHHLLTDPEEKINLFDPDSPLPTGLLREAARLRNGYEAVYNKQ